MSQISVKWIISTVKIYKPSRGYGMTLLNIKHWPLSWHFEMHKENKTLGLTFITLITLDYLH